MAHLNPVYCSTDLYAQQAGCFWGLLVDRKGSDFWVSTPIGIRYYGVENEHLYLHPGDPGFEEVHKTWQEGLQEVARLQRGLPPRLREIP